MEGEGVEPEELAKRRRLQAAFQLAYRAHPAVLERTLDVLHFYGPALTEVDMALQNAAKSLLHAAGWWGDSDDDRREIVRKLTGINLPRRSLWKKLKEWLK